LISSILLKEISVSGRINFRDFYYRRIVRLAPALFCLLIVLGMVSLIDANGRAQDFKNILLALAYLMNWSRAFSWSTDFGGFLGHTWSLSVEEQFYMIWPAAVLALVSFRKQASAIIVILIAAAFLWRGYLVFHGAPYARTYNGFDTHADPLLIGCLLAFVPELTKKYAGLADKLIAIPLLTMAVVLFKMHIFSKYGQYIGVSVTAVCAAWIVVATFNEGLLTKVLSIKPLVYTGRISYGWYLWHYPVIYIANHMISPNYVLPKGSNVALVLVAYLMAMASFHFVERPISVKFKYWLHKPHPAISRRRKPASSSRKT
jgi:peptidoglycan/LPS O-acetylase OafA/YrhL